jgi:hypothetical protein
MDMKPSRPGSHFADRHAAEQALAMTLPMIEPAMADPLVSSFGFLYLVVMDPALTPADCSFEDAVLLEHAVGDRSRWDADYAGFARAKARLAWSRGDSHALQALQPHRLCKGDSLLWGSAVLDGIVVAASGAFPWFDEAFATALAANLRAIAKQRHAAALEKRQLSAGG